MKYWIMWLAPVLAHAGFSEIPESGRYSYQQKRPAKVSTTKNDKKKPARVKSGLDSRLEKLMQSDKAIAELLKKQEKSVIVRKMDDKVIALTRVRGVLLNSVLAMNVKPSKFIVRITEDHPELEGAELRCLGFSFEKRVPGQCNLLVMDEQEFEVDVDIWDMDGAEGIIADYYYSGEEKTFLTSSFAAFLGATFDVAKGGVSSPFALFLKIRPRTRSWTGLSEFQIMPRRNSLSQEREA